MGPLSDEQGQHSSSAHEEDALQEGMSTSQPHISEGRVKVADRLQGDSSPAVATCRVCLEEDVTAKLVQPCSCSGSMQNAHQVCIQHWINSKGNMLCEVCKQPYEGDFIQPPPCQQPVALMQEQEYDSGPSSTWCLAAVFIFMSLLLLRQLVEVVSLPSHQAESGEPGKPEVPADISIGDGGVTYSWGFNGTDSAASGPRGVDAFGAYEIDDVSPWLVLLWLAIRFVIVMCPFFIVVKLMSTMHVPPNRQPDVTERDLAALILNMEAGLRGPQASSSGAGPVAGQGRQIRSSSMELPSWNAVEPSPPQRRSL